MVFGLIVGVGRLGDRLLPLPLADRLLPGLIQQLVVLVLRRVRNALETLEAVGNRGQAGSGGAREIQDLCTPESHPKVAVELPQHAGLAVGEFKRVGVDAPMPIGVEIVEVCRASANALSSVCGCD